MLRLQYPPPRFRTRPEGEGHAIFCEARRKWLRLTPEEWVRQNFWRYLTEVAGYPAGAIALERGLQLNGLQKRFDLLVHDASGSPWMLVECKRPEVALTPAVLDQVLRYRQAIPTGYMVLTNGASTWIGCVDGKGLQELSAFPLYTR